MKNKNYQDMTKELEQTQEELERSQLQLSQLLIDLEQSHTQLEEMKLQNLDHKEEELERSQLQMCQLLMELEKSHMELFYTQSELKESESLKKQIQVELEQKKSNLEKTQRELADTQSVLRQTQGELDRYKFGEAIASQIISERERQYHQFVWDAWYAYRNGDINHMVDCLQKSLQYTSLSRTKTISNWVKKWNYFCRQKGSDFEIHNLNNIPEWNKLLKTMIRVKYGRYFSR